MGEGGGGEGNFRETFAISVFIGSHQANFFLLAAERSFFVGERDQK